MNPKQCKPSPEGRLTISGSAYFSTIARHDTIGGITTKHKKLLASIRDNCQDEKDA